MKNVCMSLLLIMGISLSVSAQQKMKAKDRDVPEAVKTAIKNAYPRANDVEWKMMDGMYKAKFDMNGKDYIASVSASGEIKSKGQEIAKNELPAVVTTAIQSAHAGWRIDDVYRVEQDGKTKYLVELDGNPDKMVLYSEDGTQEKEMADD